MTITDVEIMLSRIPCNDVSPAWYTSGPEGSFPIGCGPKLLTLIQREQDIQWTLAYEEINTHTENVDKINDLTNAEAGDFPTLVEGWQTLESPPPEHYYPNFVIVN